MHAVRRSSEYALAPHPLFRAHSDEYRSAALIDHDSGSVHTGLSLHELSPGGFILPHLHSFEESFYILEGQVTLSAGDDAARLDPGSYGVHRVGTLHAWRNHGAVPVRWLQMAAPQPKPPGQERDTYFLQGGRPPDAPSGAMLVSQFHADRIPSTAADRAAASALPNVFLKWLIDEPFGARHHRLALIEYLPGDRIGLHDHAFEESYFVLSGEIEATLDGQRYVARPGDVLWTGVGCVHAFVNAGAAPVRWLETFAPLPPQENAFRFFAEWDAKGRAIEEGGSDRR
jgi:quercetin dioxygenase-like cupin family protein